MAGSANNPPPRRIPIRPDGGSSSRDLPLFLAGQTRLKVIIKAVLGGDKGRNKALKVCATVPGVFSVAITGEEKDQVEVTGNMDAVRLVQMLRKKVSYASLLSVEHACPTSADGRHGNVMCRCLIL